MRPWVESHSALPFVSCASLDMWAALSEQASLAHLGMGSCGMLSPGSVLTLWVLLFHNRHDYDLLVNSPEGCRSRGLCLPICGLLRSREVPRVLLWEGKVRWQLGGGRGGCASCPLHPRPRLGGSGRGCVCLVPALSDWSQAPLAALLGESEPRRRPRYPSLPPSGAERVPLCLLSFRNSGCHFLGLAEPAGCLLLLVRVVWWVARR